MANAIGKFLKGVSAVAVPAALEEQQARIAEKRDARLQAFQAGESEKDRAARAGENQAGRAFQAEQGRLDRKQRAQIHGETLQATLEYQGMQYEANEADRKDRLKVVEAQLKNANLESELKTIELDDAKSMRKAYDAIMDDSLTDEQRLAAIEYVNLRNPKSNNRFTVTQLKDDMGDPTDEVLILNRETGAISRLDTANLGAYGQGDGGFDVSTLTDPNAVKDAFRKGLIDREAARKRLAELVQSPSMIPGE